ncbi:MAG TPA: TonB-dependent receptor [Vicinamibacterales bacterium]|nr:TonB-dependent receptor [Vicinamibacterales bacterium]
MVTPGRVLAAIVFVLSLATFVFAQASASISGTVHDASGAVLPGVTVEASSPALIEKSRTAVSDGAGQYRIEQLRGGTYTVTFSLQGFQTLKREGVELTGSFAATVNADLKIGAVAETVTVSGEAPVVDIQSATKQRVVDQELLVAIPTGRTPQVAAFLIPGVSLSNVDVGGTNIINTTGGSLSVHGGNLGDTRLLIDGVTIANTEGTGYSTNMLPNMGSTQEVAVDYSANTAESISGGLQINMIPKTGGNQFSGSLFATGATSSMQGSNSDPTLVARGLATPNSVKSQGDLNPAFGGPLQKDKLWFYTSARVTDQENYVGGLYRNLNAYDITKWTYVPDTAHQAVNAAREKSVNLRLTWQSSPKNKFNFFYDNHWRCQCAVTAPTISEEAANNIEYPISDLRSVSYTSTPTNKILIEARFGVRREEYAYTPTSTLDPQRLLIPVTEQGGAIPGLLYRGGGISTATQPYQRTLGVSIPFGASLAYVTGSHSFKTGFYNVTARRDSHVFDDAEHLSYQFLNGVPNQLTERATPLDRSERQRMDLGIFAQDKWTVKRLTLSYGVRLDHFESYFPAQTLGPAPLVPNRNLSFPETPMANWSDITPRLGSAYDLFGNGTTAVRVSINKYVLAEGLQGTYGDTDNPVNRLANFVNRSWIDQNHNFVPDCDLTNPLAQDNRATGGDLCGVVTDTNFGAATPSLNYDPAVLNGWGSRPYQWEFSTSVQRQITRGVSVDVGYFRRWYGNFGVTDNLNLSAADFNTFSITAPLDPRLPGGGGNTINGFYNVSPAKVALPQNNYFTLASNYGNQIQHWNGFDVSMNARLRRGFTVQGGVSSGRQETNNCDVIKNLPEAALLTAPYCDEKDNFLTDGKLIGTYEIPRVDVAFSALFYSRPGPVISANKVFLNSDIAPSLGRPLAGNAQNITVNMLFPGTLYGDRRNQLDLRLTKNVRVQRLKIGANVELYNVFNTNAVLTENATYRDTTQSGWRIPTSIAPPRLLKFSLQLDF